MSGEEEEEEAGYEVEEILRHRQVGNETSYLLKWKGFPSSENSWEIESNLNCKELLESYWEKVREDEKKREKEREKKEREIKEKERKERERKEKEKKEKEKSNEKEKKEDHKEQKPKRKEARIQITGVRKDASGRLFFMTHNKWTGESIERPFSYVKNHFVNSLIDYFESSLSFSSVINVKKSEIKMDKI